MAEVALSATQKDIVRRYVETWRRCRPGIRAFARLEDDMDSCRGVLADGIAVDNRPGGSVIVADDKDTDFYAAIFEGDDGAIPDMTPDGLEQARHYIIEGEGAVPVRRWRHYAQATNRRVVNFRSSAAAV